MVAAHCAPPGEIWAARSCFVRFIDYREEVGVWPHHYYRK
jgi:hypothetical protein